VAAAVKLTPAVFLLYFLLRRDRRAALTAGLSFLVATGIGARFAGADSLRYWTGLVFDDKRIGNPWYAGNQSWLGLLSHLGVTGGAWWLVLVAGTVAVTVVGMRRALAAWQHVVALGLNAVCGLLISPISWSHHWVWIVVVLPGWAALGRRLPYALAGGGLLLFLASPQWWWPRGGTAEQHWTVLQQITGSGYVLFGALLLGTAAVFRWYPTDGQPRTGRRQVAIVHYRQWRPRIMVRPAGSVPEVCGDVKPIPPSRR
jgi:alpha-1,2-mannosyltransferase